LDLSEPFDSSTFEYWSQMLLRALTSGTGEPVPSYVVRERPPLRAPHLVCVVGEVGSGKTEAARVLRDQFGYVEINSGRVMARLLRLPPVPETDRDEFHRRAYGYVCRPGGAARFAAQMVDAARRAGSGRVVIDGIRQEATLRELISAASPTPVGVLFVSTAPLVAFEFFRNREDSGVDLARFLSLRGTPGELEVAGLVDHAHAVVHNWRGLARYRRAIAELMVAVGNLPNGD
jgi:predicted kinase